MVWTIDGGSTSTYKNKVSSMLLAFGLMTTMLLTSLAPFIQQVQAAATDKIVVNEFMANPVSINDSDAEWIELANESNVAVDISGWKLDDGASPYTFPAATQIDANGFLVICADSTLADANCDLQWSGISLAQSGDTITLKDASDIDVDSVSYDASDVIEGASSEVAETGDGLKIIEPNTTDTYTSGNTGTPGAANSFTIASAPSEVTITNLTELRSAIENQADGQTWTIQPGSYGLAPFAGITVNGQTGWHFPVTANNLTIIGVGNPTIYGTGYTKNGNHSSQNLITVFGNEVTIDGLTFMPKIEPNKTLEVLGSDFTLRNSVFTPNTLTDQTEYDSVSWGTEAKQWGGSLYFSHAGNHTVENVTIKNSGISYRYSPSGTNIELTNVVLEYYTHFDWINSYRYSSGFNNAGSIVSGTPQVIYHIDSTLDNLDSVLASMQDGDVIELDSDLTTGEQITLDKAVTFDGNGHTIDAAFTKTDNGNNSAIGIQSDNVTIKNLTVDGQNGTNLHGINLYEVSNIVIDTVTAKEFRSGIGINSSSAIVRNVTTSGNIWHGINVDTVTSQQASLTIESSSEHAENSPTPPSDFVDGTHVPHIFIDDVTDGSTVNDINSQYRVAEVDFRGERALVYTLKVDSEAPIFSIENPVNGDTVRGTIDIRARITDDSGVKKVLMTIPTKTGNKTFVYEDGKTNNSLTKDGDVYYTAIDTNTLNDGVTHVVLRGTDNAGNTRYWNNNANNRQHSFVVDNNGPEVNDIVLNGQAINLGDVRADNCEPVTKFHTVNGEIDLRATLTDTTSDVSSAKYRVRKVTPGGCTVSSVFSSGNVAMSNTSSDIWEDLNGFDTSDVPEDGEYTIYLQVADSAGNTTTKYVDILVDNTAPLVGISNPVNGSLHNSDVKLRATVTDDNPHHYWLQVKRNGSPVNISGVTGTRSATESFTDKLLTTFSDEGTYEITLAARDAADSGTSTGNRSRNIVITFTIDKTNPEIAVNNLAVSNDKKLSFDLTATDGSSGLDIIAANIYDETNTTKLIELGSGNPTRLNDPHSGLPEGTATFSTSLSDIDVSGLPTGTYTIRAYARDHAGNQLRFELVQFDVDNTAPLVTITSVDQNSDGTYTILGSSDDTAPVTVTIKNSGDDGDVTPTNGAWSYTSSILTPGDYIVTATSTDAMGNNTDPEATQPFSVPAPSESSQGGTGGGDGDTNNEQQTNTTTDNNPTLAFAPTNFAANEPQVLGLTANNTDDNQQENQNTDTDENIAGEVLGSATAPQASQNLAAATSSCSKIIGICWYYWIPVVLAVFGFGYLSYMRRNIEN